jgi:hypothetical protein
MCIAKVEAYEHRGQLFRTEQDALKAALKDIGTAIQKDWSHSVHDGLSVHSEALLRVLGRMEEIEAAKPRADMPRYDDMQEAA